MTNSGLKRLLCILLGLAIAFPLLLCSCNNDVVDTSSVVSSDDSSVETSVDTFTDDTGLEYKNWGGETVRFITFNSDVGYYNREIAPTQVKTEDYSGEYVFDAVCERAQIIKEKYGINVECYFPESGKTPSEIAINEQLGGTHEYQVLCDSLVRSAATGLDNRLYDIDVLGIDTSKSFWDQTAISDLSVSGHLFYLTGDIVVSDDQATWCCFFNKDIVSDYSLDDPYQLVKDGNWTIDEEIRLGKIYSDYNTSLSGFTWENGRFGLVTQTYDGITSMAGCNQKMITKDANDVPILDLTSSAMVNKFDKVYTLMTDSFNAVIAEKIGSWQDSSAYINANSIFFDNRALFQYNKVQYVLDLAEHKVNFGIIPMPKYDTEQPYYNTTCTVYWSLFVSVPKSVDPSQFELIGYTLQLMAYYGQKLVTPAYYDVTIKSQKVQDTDSEYMLDLIFSHRVYDIAAAYNFSEGLQLYTSVIASGTNSFISTADKKAPLIQTAIDNTIADLEKIK